MTLIDPDIANPEIANPEIAAARHAVHEAGKDIDRALNKLRRLCRRDLKGPAEDLVQARARIREARAVIAPGIPAPAIPAPAIPARADPTAPTFLLAAHPAAGGQPARAPLANAFTGNGERGRP